MPTQVEIFQANNPKELQDAINKWLKDHPDIRLEEVAQSQVQHGQSGPMPITISIWYDLPKYK